MAPNNGPDLRRQAGPHVFVDDLANPTLDDADHHHLARSLRLRDGDPLTLSDGAGRWRTAAFGAAPEPTGPIIDAGRGEPVLAIAIALTKSGKPELATQKATEIGIDRIIVFAGDRSVPRWDDAKAAKARVRLARVAREAAMQSRQLRIPDVEIVADLAAVVEHVGAGLVRADFGAVGDGPDAAVRCIAIGPEGGWSDAEIAAVPAVVDLGPSVLRAETAAVVAAAKLVATRSSGCDR